MPVNMPLPTKAKVTAFVCSGRSRPKLTNCQLKFASGKKLDGGRETREESDDAPDNGGHRESADDAIVVSECFDVHER